MALDRQAVERRDFPISRRGYDPAAVDAHLRALASELEELQRARAAGADDSLADEARDSLWRRALIRNSSTCEAISERCASTAAGS